MGDRLYRSRDDRLIAGVAGGLAERFNLDPALVRTAWALLAFLTGGVAVVLYIVMAIVVPDEDDLFGARPPSSAITRGYAPGAQSTPPTGQPTRDEWRAQRRAAREARRRERGPLGGALLIGVMLILVAVWYLLREHLPALDPGRASPYVIVALGIVLLVIAFRRRWSGGRRGR